MTGGAPLLVLGVRRSGTTLLRVILDRSSALAIPDESYFVPQLAERHGAHVDPDDFLDDLSRLPTVREWDVSLEEVRGRLRPGMALGDAVAAVYETYAARFGKARWGDKTPMYMAYLPLLERLFPTALYVHLIRDGRDAATSFLAMPRGIVTESWAHPRTAAGFACQWWTEVEAARALGRRVGDRYLEVRYEDLVRAPAAAIERICAFAGLAYEPSMLAYPGEVDVSSETPPAAPPQCADPGRPRLAVPARARGRRRVRGRGRQNCSPPWATTRSLRLRPRRGSGPGPSSRRTWPGRRVAHGRSWRQALASLEAAPPAARVGDGEGAGRGASARQAAASPTIPR